MRKFTKEITALLASVAVGATVGTASVTSEEIVETAGVVIQTDEYTETTTTTEEDLPLAGVTIPATEYTDPTEEFPPTAGVPLPPDDYTESTDPTEEIPPLAGEPTLPDEYIETTEEIPPLAGDVMLIDGDIDGNGSFNSADVVSFSKHLLNKSDAEYINSYVADLCPDGDINVFDFIMMKRQLIGQNISASELSEKSYDYEQIEDYDNIAEYKDGGQNSVYIKNNEALVMWKIPVLYEMNGCVSEITSIDSCTYKTNDTDTIEIVKSDNVYYYGDTPKGYTYCVVKALKEGKATLTLDCEYSDTNIEFTIDENLNISVTD
ncbi:MAG: dockerin type I repeat-containing protein [Oscillospiraceae bacterium]|nr:dockerin type I repeat-containing protein [Oscillospiraceae bacterium]